MAMTIRVTDRRNKYPTKEYVVETDNVMTAYAEACEKFIKDNGHPPYVPGKRMSVYYSRFWNERVA